MYFNAKDGKIFRNSIGNGGDMKHLEQGTSISSGVAAGLIVCLAAIFSFCFNTHSAFATAPKAVKAENVLNAVEKVSPTIEEVGLKVWELSELSLVEVKSLAYLKEVLQENGFTITSDGTANVPTAFVAEYSRLASRTR